MSSPAAAATSDGDTKPMSRTKPQMPTKSRKATSATKEKRLKRHRPRATQKILDRIERALSQRLYLVHTSDVHPRHPQHGGPYCELAVLGSTGNLYTVTLCRVPNCDCPDHAKGNLCKHILFVMLKVVGLPSDSDLVYQAALLTTELEDIFDTMQQRRDGLFGTTTAAAAASSNANADVVANQSVRDSYARMTGRGDEVKGEEKGQKAEAEDAGSSDNEAIIERKPIEGDCPICFDPLQGSSGQQELTFCRLACGTNFHSQCMKMWSSQQKSSTERANANRLQATGHNKSSAGPTCPACRQPWSDVATGGVDPNASPDRKRKAHGDEGYVNLGELQGQSPVRDTSTYHTYSPRGYGYSRKRRYW